jgi:hypothetical protein
MENFKTLKIGHFCFNPSLELMSKVGARTRKQAKLMKKPKFGEMMDLTK